MSISSIGGNTPVSSLFQTSGVSSVRSSGQDADGDGDGGRVRGGGGGKFASALNQALSQLGITTSSANPVSATSLSSSSSGASSSTTAQDPQQAIAAFAQSLFAALQSQVGAQNSSNSANASNSANSSDGVNAVSGAGGSGGGHHHHHHGGGGGIGKLESGLQNLISQLSSSSGSSSSGSASSGSSSGSSSSTLDALQQSFTNLLSAEGQSGNKATLSSFLGALSQNLHGASATGNVVSTQV